MFKRLARCLLLLLLLLLALACVGCATGGTPGPAAAGGASTAGSSSAQQPAICTLKDRLDVVIRDGLKPTEVATAVGTFTLGDYVLQDPGTFWGHRAVPGAGGSFSEYYLTYRGEYVILLLRDLGAGTYRCMDARLFPRTSRDYELATVRVQVDDQPIDEDIIVLVNRKWPGGSSSDIRAAFRANADTGRIEDVAYHVIRIFREE